VSLVDIGPFGKKTIPPALQVTFTDSAGTAINVTSMTVTCTIRPVGGSSADDVIRTGAVVTGASGIVKYQWVEADTTTPGSYRAWMHVSDADEQYTAPDVYCFVVTDNPIPSGW
jgi:myosin-crossreactive antigen